MGDPGSTGVSFLENVTAFPAVTMKGEIIRSVPSSYMQCLVNLDPSFMPETSLNALDHTPLVDIGVLLDVGIVRQLQE
jgi:hypothetical protein